MEYQERIVQLQIKSGQLAAPSTVSYHCAGEDQPPFSVLYYNDAVPPAAVLMRGQDQVIAFIAPSGSGARYVSEGVELWEHQGEATVTWFGIRLICKVLQ